MILGECRATKITGTTAVASNLLQNFGEKVQMAPAGE